jgi:hypothetical protein
MGKAAHKVTAQDTTEKLGASTADRAGACRAAVQKRQGLYARQHRWTSFWKRRSQLAGLAGC